MEKNSDSHVGAVERLQTAQQERDQRAEQYDVASGSLTELPAYTELKAAEERVAARQAWLGWVESDY